MAGSTAPGPQIDRDPDAIRDEWLARLSDLVANVRSWAEGSGWKTREITKSMKDTVLGAYRAPALLMQQETFEVILNPVSRFVPGAEGAVDLDLMPAYDDIASLYFEGGQWTIHYAFHTDPMQAHSVVETQALIVSQATINRVLNDFIAHAA